MLQPDRITTTVAPFAVRLEAVPPGGWQEQKRWLEQAGQLLWKWDQMADYSLMAQAGILYYVHAAWESLDKEATSFYHYDFMTWARRYTKSRAGRLAAASTIRNKITIYRDFIAEPMPALPKTVFVRVYDEGGNLVPDPDGFGYKTVEVPFEEAVRLADFGKLLVARRQARQGVLSQPAVEALFDPHATVRALKAAMQEQDHGKRRVLLWCEGPLLIARFDGNADTEAIVVARFEEENAGHPVFAAAMHRLVGQLKIDVPVELQFGDDPSDLPAVMVDGDTIIINKDGRRFGTFRGEELDLLRRALAMVSSADDNLEKAI